MENSLSSNDVSVLIDHLLKSKDPATVGLRKILKNKQDRANEYPLHPLAYEDFLVVGATKDSLTQEEKHVLELEKKVKDLESKIKMNDDKAKAAIDSSRASGLKEGMAKGEEEGKKKAKADFDRQVSLLQNKIGMFLESLESSKKKIYTDVHTILLNLCLELTKKIIYTECVTNPDVVISVITKSLSYISDREKLVVRVAKEDMETVSTKKDFWVPIDNRAGSISIEQDDRVEKGGCIIETNSGVVDARLGVQIAELKDLVEKTWHGVISSSAA